jgi:hypothetical protein
MLYDGWLSRLNHYSRSFHLIPPHRPSLPISPKTGTGSKTTLRLVSLRLYPLYAWTRTPVCLSLAVHLLSFFVHSSTHNTQHTGVSRNTQHTGTTSRASEGGCDRHPPSAQQAPTPPPSLESQEGRSAPPPQHAHARAWCRSRPAVGPLRLPSRAESLRLRNGPTSATADRIQGPGGPGAEWTGGRGPPPGGTTRVGAGARGWAGDPGPVPGRAVGRESGPAPGTGGGTAPGPRGASRGAGGSAGLVADDGVERACGRCWSNTGQILVMFTRVKYW